MATDSTEIVNAAFIKIGAPKVANLSGTDDPTVAANARLEPCKKACLRRHPWNFAVKRDTLTPTYVTVSAVSNNGTLVRLTATSHGASTGNRVTVEDVTGVSGTWVVTVINANTIDLVGSTYSASMALGTTPRLTIAPRHGWTYRIALPSDCLRVLTINDRPASEFLIEGRFVVTDASEIDLKYIFNVTDYTAFDVLFDEFFATYLAWDICYRVTQSSTLKGQLADDLRTQMASARFTDATEDPTMFLDASDWIDSRFAPAAGRYVRDPMT